MDSIVIIYPAIAMFTLTFSMIMTLGLSRFVAIKRKKVSIKFYQHYTDGTQPERLHILGRHVQNHFEVPPLFYIGILFTFVTNSITYVALCAAWLFVLLRCLHTIIHLGSNNVSRRFVTFLLSLLCVFSIWASLFVVLVERA